MCGCVCGVGVCVCGGCVYPPNQLLYRIRDYSFYQWLKSQVIPIPSPVPVQASLKRWPVEIKTTKVNNYRKLYCSTYIVSLADPPFSRP